MDHQTQLGKYHLLRQLGTGATSVVYLGHDPFAEREVALKVFKQEFLDDPKSGRQNRKQLENEAALAGKLAHPHIVTTYDAVISHDQSYIVMEYVPGGTLEKHILPDNLLPLDRVVEYLFKCCRALNYAQFNGVIHRDIKPANLLLADPDEIKISDLGAAIRLDTSKHAAAMSVRPTTCHQSKCAAKRSRIRPTSIHWASSCIACSPAIRLTARRTWRTCTSKSCTKNPYRPPDCAPICRRNWNVS